jgi:hypothetical protein
MGSSHLLRSTSLRPSRPRLRKPRPRLPPYRPTPALRAMPMPSPTSSPMPLAAPLPFLRLPTSWARSMRLRRLLHAPIWMLLAALLLPRPKLLRLPSKPSVLTGVFAASPPSTKCAPAAIRSAAVGVAARATAAVSAQCLSPSPRLSPPPPPRVCPLPLAAVLPLPTLPP